MEFVVDASVVIQSFVTEAYTPNVTVLFEQLEDEVLYVPDFCLLECNNVIWKQVRFHGMQLLQARILAQDLSVLPLTKVSSELFLVEALEIGVKYNLAVYDSIYIAMAKHYKCPLITVDEPQARAAKAEGVTLKALTDFVQ